jgi:cell division protein FtsX
MEPDLRRQFDLAVSDDPGADPAAMADAAMFEGGRMRRRRRMQLAAAGVAAGVVLVLGAVSGVNLMTGAPESTEAPVTVEAAMMPKAAPSCSVKPVTSDATDVAVFLAMDTTDAQLAALSAALHDDRRVGTVRYESREDAYQRFRALWADHPKLVASVGPKQLVESFRVRLVDPAQYTAFRAHYAAMAGVDQVIGHKCPANAPVGGIQ